jgi:hypothetical protein
VTKRDLQIAVLAVLETLAESSLGSAPESYCYLPLGQVMVCTLDDWRMIKDVMVGAGLVTAEHDQLFITDKARDLVKRIAEDRAVAKARKETGT